MRGAVGAVLVLALATGCAATRPAQQADAWAPHQELQLAEAESAAAPAPAAPQPRHHTVEPGQTFYRISRMYGCTPEALMDANGMQDPRALRTGQVLRIPECASATSPVALATAPAAPPQQGEGGEEGPAALARAPQSGQEPSVPVGLRPETARVRGRVVPAGRERAGGEVSTRGMLDWPLRGVLYGRFGKRGREPHDGIDLAAPEGTPVRAAAAGTVLYAGEQRGYGNIVLLEHPNGLITLYAHNRDVRVRTGQAVRDGQVVATVGESGRTSGPHLHFEVRRGGVPVDPLQYLGTPPAR